MTDTDNIAAVAAVLADMNDDDWRALPEVDRRALVAEAFHTFSEGYARDLAVQLDVAFGACREEIERVGRRLN